MALKEMCMLATWLLTWLGVRLFIESVRGIAVLFVLCIPLPLVMVCIPVLLITSVTTTGCIYGF